MPANLLKFGDSQPRCASDHLIGVQHTALDIDESDDTFHVDESFESDFDDEAFVTVNERKATTRSGKRSLTYAFESSHDSGSEDNADNTNSSDAPPKSESLHTFHYESSRTKCVGRNEMPDQSRASQIW